MEGGIVAVGRSGGGRLCVSEKRQLEEVVVVDSASVRRGSWKKWWWVVFLDSVSVRRGGQKTWDKW